MVEVTSMIANKMLSKDCLEIISELKKATKGGKIRTEVTALSLGGGYVWGVVLGYFDDEGTIVAEETFYTMKGSTRRSSGFTVLFDEDGNELDGEMQNFYLSEKSKTISEFITGVIEEKLSPSLLVMMHAGLEETISCDIGDDEEDDEDADADDDDDDDDDSDDSDDDEEE
jgi:hypothetical protein